MIKFFFNLFQVFWGLIRLAFWSLFTLVMLLLAVGFFCIAVAIFASL
jgi:hypothetical protein